MATSRSLVLIDEVCLDCGVADDCSWAEVQLRKKASACLMLSPSR